MKDMVRDRNGRVFEVEDGYVLKDGEGPVVTMMMMDGRRPLVHDGNGNVAGTRPGFLVSDSDADEAVRQTSYAMYDEALGNRWRNPPQGQPSPKAQPQPTSDSAATVADAYAQYDRELAARWKNAR